MMNVGNVSSENIQPKGGMTGERRSTSCFGRIGKYLYMPVAGMKRVARFFGVVGGYCKNGIVNLVTSSASSFRRAQANLSSSSLGSSVSVFKGSGHGGGDLSVVQSADLAATSLDATGLTVADLGKKASDLGKKASYLGETSADLGETISQLAEINVSLKNWAKEQAITPELRKRVASKIKTCLEKKESTLNLDVGKHHAPNLSMLKWVRRLELLHHSKEEFNINGAHLPPNLKKLVVIAQRLGACTHHPEKSSIEHLVLLSPRIRDLPSFLSSKLKTVVLEKDYSLSKTTSQYPLPDFLSHDALSDKPVSEVTPQVTWLPSDSLAPGVLGFTFSQKGLVKDTTHPTSVASTNASSFFSPAFKEAAQDAFQDVLNSTVKMMFKKEFIVLASPYINACLKQGFNDIFTWASEDF